MDSILLTNTNNAYRYLQLPPMNLIVYLKIIPGNKKASK